MATAVAKCCNVMSVITVTGVCNIDIHISILAMCSQ